MIIRSIKVLQGPNLWSQKLTLIAMELDLEELEFRPTNKIPGFYERLKSLIPSLYEHKCSEGEEGGFYTRIQEGTWMGHVIEHIAIELQVIAGMYCPYGKTRGSGEFGVYNVVFEYKVEQAGLYAARAAVDIADALINGKEYNIQKDIETLISIRDKYSLGPSTQALVNEAQRRNIPWRRLNDFSLLMFGYGKEQKMISTALTSSTSCIAVDIACDKELTKSMLNEARIPVPEGIIAENVNQLDEAIQKLGYPLVVKPNNGNHGRMVSIDLNTHQEVYEAYKRAKECSDRVIIEKLVTGEDFRILLVDYKFICATKRIPAMVIGDGRKTIKQLVDEVNKDPMRGPGHTKGLTRIEINQDTIILISKQGYTLESIPLKNEPVRLKSTANLSTGGTGVDVTDLVHPYNINLAERAARIIGLDICGLDIMAPCLTMPIHNNGGAIMEANASPGLRMHLCPTQGTPRYVTRPIIRMLYPNNKNGQIPIVAVTGTNGKTTTSRLIAHLSTVAGYHTGLTTSDGVYNNGKIIDEGDCTGPISTRMILREPDVEFAVLECARGGILRAGLGFNQCDIGIITNISEDHLGLDGIHSLDMLTRVKSVVPKSVKRSGHAILNAEDDRVYRITEDLSCYIALFGLCYKNPRIKNHCKRGGIAAYLHHGDIIIQEGDKSYLIASAYEAPLTFGNKAEFNIKNILAAVLTGYIQGFGIDVIRKGLLSFIPTSITLPGRMNLFKFPDFDVLVDYAHNPTAINELGKYLRTIDAKHLTGIITGIGDRRDQDIINVGCAASQVFDDIIIKHDDDLRGRKRDEITELLIYGIKQISPLKSIKVISSEIEAIKYAINDATTGSCITALCANVPRVLRLIEGMHGDFNNITQHRQFNIK